MSFFFVYLTVAPLLTVATFEYVPFFEVDIYTTYPLAPPTLFQLKFASDLPAVTLSVGVAIVADVTAIFESEYTFLLSIVLYAVTTTLYAVAFVSFVKLYAVFVM